MLKIQNVTILIFLLILVSCQKERPHGLSNLKEALNLKNYQIQKTQFNDTIQRIKGENSNYTISGNLNSKTGRKDGWWYVSSKNINERYEVQFLDFKPENFNQAKYYLDDQLLDELSVYYDIKREKNNFLLRVNFPKEKGNQFANLHYQTYDTVSKKSQQDEKKEIRKKSNSYFVHLPAQKDHNAIVGSITEFTVNGIKGDSMKLGTFTIYFQH